MCCAKYGHSRATSSISLPSHSVPYAVDGVDSHSPHGQMVAAVATSIAAQESVQDKMGQRASPIKRKGHESLHPGYTWKWHKRVLTSQTCGVSTLRLGGIRIMEVVQTG